MKRNKYFILTILAIMLITYSLLVFTIAGETTTRLWVCYGFTLLAFVFLAVVVTIGFSKNTDSFIRLPLPIFGAVYLGIQVVLGCVLMALPLNNTVAVVIQVLPLAVCLILVISSVMTHVRTEAIDRETGRKVFNIRALTEDVQAHIGAVDDPLLRKKLNTLYETIRYSDPMSQPSLVPLEQRIEEQIALLSLHIKNSTGGNISDACETIMQLMDERNRKCRIQK